MRNRPIRMISAALLILHLCEAASVSSSQHLVLPAEVVVSSHASVVEGSDRDGRILAGTTIVGADGIPVVHGVRVRESQAEREEPVWRNARVIGGQLFPNDDFSISSPPSSADRSVLGGAEAKEAKSFRQGRILSFQDSGAPDSTRNLSTLPPFYYRDYYKTAPNSGSRQEALSARGSFVDPSENEVGVHSPTRTTSQPVRSAVEYQAFFDPKLAQQAYPGSHLQAGYSPSAGAPYSSQLSSSVPRVPVSVYSPAGAQGTAAPLKNRRSRFKHRFQQVQQRGNVRFPSSNNQSPGFPSSNHQSPGFPSSNHESPAGQIIQPGSYQVPAAAAQFEDSVDPFSGRPVDPNQFKIQQMSFQSVPGGPIVNIPVPIPHTQQAQPASPPNRRFSFFDALGLGGLFGGNRRADQQPNQQTVHYPHSSSVYSDQNQNPYLQETSQPSFMDSLTAPIRRLGESVIELTRPFRATTNQLTEELGLGSLYPQQQPQLDNKQGTVADPGEALVVGGLVAGAGVLAGISFMLYANTVTNDTHYIIGRRRRSVDLQPRDVLMDNLLGGLDPVQTDFLQRLQDEGLQRWGSPSCAKRIFCDFMTDVDESTVKSFSNRVTTFLSYLDTGEPGGLMSQAKQLQRAVVLSQCSEFSCSSAVQTTAHDLPVTNQPAQTSSR